MKSVVLVFIVLSFHGNLRCDAQDLPDDEVQTLRAIFSALEVPQWNWISSNICFNGSELISCDCSFNDSTICHVTNIQLTSMNLNGQLPNEFVNLSYLREISLMRNFFEGSIPKSWASLPLRNMSLIGNYISGSIPKEIGSVATLEELVLEDNNMGGPIPLELGNLGSLRRLLLSGNKFTGVLPETFGNLKNLTDFRISGSSITGRIPEFIGNWTKLNRLDMLGTSMEGPIPFTISLLKNLTQMRISDLNASDMIFPDLQELMNLKELVLRNCSITGHIPSYIGKRMLNLKTLDLSFNSLIGAIPETLQQLSNLEYMYLTNNSLTGYVPPWISDTREYLDISYNNFTGTSQSNCKETNVNKISSFSSLDNKSTAWCLKKDLPCPWKPNYSNLFINCGGSNLSFEGKEYEQDLMESGPSSFFSTEKWACSTTGHFLGNESSRYTARARTPRFAAENLFTTARLAPLSLKYYGRCLRKGSYTVKLYFAEILFTEYGINTTMGRRIFDVFIQGDKVLTDFNIAEEAGGIGRGIIKEYNNIMVTGSSLEIHLYWSGKGTTALPERGVYGPLISAISVTSNIDPRTRLSAGAITGIVLASIVVVLLILIILWKKGYLGGKDLEDKELRGLDLQTGYFTLRQIKAATGNFNPAYKIGEGGFGPVYKGVLPDGSLIAVKQLSAKSNQGNREFVNEIGMLSTLQHPHLVRLFGCCIEGNQLLLIYEYMINNSLAHALFGREEKTFNLDWPTRQKICLGIARGLAYLHEESRIKIVHRDVKATNVLLDKDLTAKISDFGLAKLNEEDNTHISTRIAGTIGYMAPEYALKGYLTPKADVFSFGVLALEIVSGKSNTNYRTKDDFVYLPEWACVLQEQGNLLELVDKSLESKYSKEALKMLNIAILCINPEPSPRPAMSAVVSMLESHKPVQAPIVKSSSMINNKRLEAFQLLSDNSETSLQTVRDLRPTKSSPKITRHYTAQKTL